MANQQVQIHMIDLQIAVAKAMGWHGETTMSQILGISKTVWFNPKGEPKCLPPLTLDLMWQAEEMLSLAEQNQYWTTLLSITDDVGRTMDWRHFGHATAEQRAKAWLKVKGVEL